MNITNNVRSTTTGRQWLITRDNDENDCGRLYAKTCAALIKAINASDRPMKIAKLVDKSDFLLHLLHILHVSLLLILLCLILVHMILMFIFLLFFYPLLLSDVD